MVITKKYITAVQCQKHTLPFHVQYPTRETAPSKLNKIYMRCDLLTDLLTMSLYTGATKGFGNVHGTNQFSMVGGPLCNIRLNMSIPNDESPELGMEISKGKETTRSGWFTGGM